MKIKFKRLDHIMLCIPPGTEQQAREFYGGVLGLEELTDLGYPLPHGAIWFQMGDIQLHIRAEDVHAISQRHPALKVLYVSGYTDDTFQGRHVGGAFLQKPFLLDTLAKKIREILGE